MKSNAAPEAIAFERKQLEIINAYIGKMTGTQKCKGSTIDFRYDDTEALSYGTA